VPRILLPTTGPDDWKRFLAEPTHWRTGYSARSLAHCWEAARGEFPPEVRALLRTSPILAQAELLIAVPEHQVRLPGSGRASQTDLWVLARTEGGLASIAIEGKVSEPFGPTVGEWLAAGGENRATRLAGLGSLLGVTGFPPSVRYQLVHRAASAVLEARRFMAAHAAMIVHSFSPSAEWREDFDAFARALGASPEQGGLLTVPGLAGPSLELGWAHGDAVFLQS
jgi:hypothetical protein